MSLQTLDSVIDSVGVRFDEEAFALFGASMSGVMEQIRDVPETDKRKHLETCRELFKAGHVSWREALVKLVHGYAEKLAHIAMANPALISDDPAKWTTLQLNMLLKQHLRQELSLTKALDEESKYSTLARQEARRSGIASDPVPQDSRPDGGPIYSRVGSWFRSVAEDGPDFDVFETGFHEPWEAPAFIEDRSVFADQIERKTGHLPDRLTVIQTEREIRRVETVFAGSFDYVLRQEEHNARIALASNGGQQLAPTSKPEELNLPPQAKDPLSLTRVETNAVAANLAKKLTSKELISFTPVGDGWTGAPRKCSNGALLNTYKSIVETLGMVQIVVGQNNGNITADALRERFPDSYLYLAAGSRDWPRFIDDFRPAPQMSQSAKHRTQPGSKMPTPESVAVGFLARTTSLKPGTIKKKLSLARKSKKHNKTRRVTLGKLG